MGQPELSLITNKRSVRVVSELSLITNKQSVRVVSGSGSVRASPSPLARFKLARWPCAGQQRSREGMAAAIPRQRCHGGERAALALRVGVKLQQTLLVRPPGPGRPKTVLLLPLLLARFTMSPARVL
jgi:hypothetical protein